MNCRFLNDTKLLCNKYLYSGSDPLKDSSAGWGAMHIDENSWDLNDPKVIWVLRPKIRHNQSVASWSKTGATHFHVCNSWNVRAIFLNLGIWQYILRNEIEATCFFSIWGREGGIYIYMMIIMSCMYNV